MGNPVIIGTGINLIGIHGKAHSGKDTLVQYFCENYENTWAEAFAGPLKAACSQAFGIPVEYFNDTELKEEKYAYWGISPRMIAQFVGTELFRNNIHILTREVQGNFWVNRLAGKLSGELMLPDDGEYESGDTVIVTDLRFQNEYDFIASNGGCIIHIIREGATGSVGLPDHESEADIHLNHPEVTYRLENNDDFNSLYEKADIIMQAINEHQKRINQDFIATL